MVIGFFQKLHIYIHFHVSKNAILAITPKFIQVQGQLCKKTANHGTISSNLTLTRTKM